MKRIVAFLVALFVAGQLTVRAQQSADSLYLNLYSAIQQADTLAGSGDLRQALAKYSDAQIQLQQFKNSYPDWNPKIVNFRLKYLSEKIDTLTASLAPPTTALKGPDSTSAPNGAKNESSFIPNAADAEVAALRGQLESARAENESLLAKLKEALRVQPATADAAEFTRLQEQVKSLMKENDLLKASAAMTAAATNAANSALKTPAKQAPENESLVADLSQARQQIATLQSAIQVKQLENAALENRVRQLQSGTNVAAVLPSQNQNGGDARIIELTQERDNLLAKLGEANQQLYGSKKPEMVAQMDQLKDQVRTLRDRLAVAEAQPVPYTAAELALLKQTARPLVAGEVLKKSIKEMPAGSARLVAEAQSFFAAGQYDRAEADYLKILEQDPENSLVLGNLAAIELQEGKLDSAEKHITAALARDQNDAFNLATFGYLKFRQEKYDEALNALSRATKLDPSNPEILNYLGVTLSHKGLRPQAEAALRKALELKPDYAAAHNNLAAIYISQVPPLVELARWHYQKALEAGQPHNPELEKALAEKGAPVAP